MTEADALKAVARAQRALLALTKDSLGHDQLDGLRAATETRKHSEFYLELRDDWLSRGLIEADDADTADKIAGFKK